MSEARTSDPISEVRTELIRIAASLVTGEQLPSCFDDGNFYKSTPMAERRRVMKEIDNLDGRLKGIAMKLKAAADKLPRMKS